MSTYLRSLKKFAGCAVAVAAAAVVTSGCEGPNGNGKSAPTTSELTPTISESISTTSKSASTTSKSYEVTGKITSVRVDNKGGNIVIVAGSGSTVKVTEKLEYSDAKPKTEHSVSDGTLTLTGGDCGVAYASRCTVDYRIEVPSGVKVDAQTGGGDITGSGLGGTVLAKTDGGNVDLSFSTAPSSVTADSQGGNVTVRLPKGSYAVDASTDGGIRKVEVPVDDGSANKVKAHTSGGNVTVTSA